MSICDSGMNSKVKSGKILVEVSNEHPLLVLAQSLPWLELLEIILPDLNKTTKRGFSNLGRKLRVRIHLAAYILQQLYNLTDRETEYGIKDNAAYRAFCGFGIVDKWHAPDHTKIAKFRSRLSPETQRLIANRVAQQAVNLGIADASIVDIDSTVQEANMTYPTDAKMLRKLGMIAAKVSESLKRILPRKSKLPEVDLKDIALKARNCFFQKRYATKEEKSANQQKLWDAVVQPVTQAISACKELSEYKLGQLKWNERRALDQLVCHGESYLEESKIFIETGVATKGKRLSFHLDEVECFSKGKAHKKHEFGRAFQLARIGGNFVFAAECDSVRMDDKKSVKPVIGEHERLFGPGKIESLATDKGYYSKRNVKHAVAKGISRVGIQAPNSVENNIAQLSLEDEEALYNRRSGIEPLIGHIKLGGQLGRSRMKNDETIKASGYASILGFNLRQMIKTKTKDQEKLAA